MINETAAHALGYESAEEAVNTSIITHDQKQFTVVGVWKDYHHESLRKPVDPIIFYNRHPHEYGYYSFNVQSRQGDHLQTLEKSGTNITRTMLIIIISWIVSSVSNTDQISCLQSC
jgi:putative ABC transport system permease protein